MNYLQAENLSKSFGARLIFENLSFGLEKGQKTAIVAPNGTGKSTLMKILAGLDTPDSGRVTLNNAARVAYLPQMPELPAGKTIWQAVFETDNAQISAINAYDNALKNDDKKALESALSRMEELGAWDMEYKINEVLGQLKITDKNALTETLSGGQKKRVALAKILLSEPDLLIMDEPTNHLDIDMIEWLEKALSPDQLTLLMVTHDRYFLDAVCDTIIEIDNNRIFTYKGNFQYFLEKKTERHMAEQSELESNLNILRRETEWIRKTPQARTGKSKSRIDAYGSLKEKTAQKRTDRKIEIELDMQRMGSKIVEFIKVHKQFGDKNVLNGFSYSFTKGEKIAIAGANGTGKSTFLNLLTGKLQPDSGKVITGETIRFGYYTQDGIKFKPGERVIEHIKNIAEYADYGKSGKLTASQLLTKFDFPPDKQYTPIEKLSGGEQRRLHLLSLLISAPNFLILDEPTNDLDILTLSKLEDFLLDFPGCLIVVSHDRYFMDKIADQTFVFEGNGEVKVHIGNYTDYRAEKAGEAAAQKTNKTPQPVFAEKATAPKKAKQGLTFKEKYEYEHIEAEIAALENRKTELEKEMESQLSNPEKLISITEELGKTVNLIDEKTLRWMELEEKAGA
ncbi:MAG: ABC-F family ATP-binding cassette domain-containing protein [Flavobacteriales bacterium]|nr:ABC-F family ATP-binding cassette domain-containing protein [Flavobacteriales bacterium]